VHKLSKSLYSTLNIYNCILTYSFCLISLILPKFHNINFEHN